MDRIVQIVMFLVALVISITCHEFAHAWAANELGDPTAKRLGRLSLNPIVHFDPLGAMMIVFTTISGFGIGWGKPVPVNPYNLKGDIRVSMGLTSLVGPFTNLLLATVFAIPFRLGILSSLPLPVSNFIWVMVGVNLGLMLFNLIPLPPLDGFGIVQGVLAATGTRWARQASDSLDRLAPYGPFALLALLALGWFTPVNPVGWLLGPPLQFLWQLLTGMG